MSDTVSSKQPHITTQQQKKAELKFKVNYWESTQHQSQAQQALPQI